MGAGGGAKAASNELLGNHVQKSGEADRVVALAGNPNVGKSTAFNALTGLKQHTGNWPGKTVSNAAGVHRHGETDYILVDLPGTYSIMPHSTEEQIARGFILFGNADAVITVCDATCLERNLNLVLQVIELTPRVVVCVNLMDEAAKKGIHIDLPALESMLGVPVVGASARDGEGLSALMDAVERVCARGDDACFAMEYSNGIDEAMEPLATLAEERLDGINGKWLALRLAIGDDMLLESIKKERGTDLMDDAMLSCVEQVRSALADSGLQPAQLEDAVVADIVHMAERISEGVTSVEGAGCAGCRGCSGCRRCGRRVEGAATDAGDRKLDRILTSKRTGIPVMLALLCGVFWLTINGANLPSQLLADGLFWVQDRLTDLFMWLGAPEWLHGGLVLGVYRVLAWVVSVMLPPMAIFFPLFTLLEDFGYLPRVAFNLDHLFKKARTCGKQALTMCMVCLNL